MTTTFRGFFTFLALLMAASVVLGYAGIDRLHRFNFPPFQNPGEIIDHFGMFPYPSDSIVVFLDSVWGRITAWVLLIAIPLTCGIAAFRFNRTITGGALLLLTTAVYAALGFSLFFHANLDATTF